MHQQEKIQSEQIKLNFHTEINEITISPQAKSNSFIEKIYYKSTWFDTDKSNNSLLTANVLDLFEHENERISVLCY